MKALRRAGSAWLAACAAAAACGGAGGPVPARPPQAQRIENADGQLRGPRQGHGGGQAAAVELNKTETFRTLKITPRACNTRDPSEPPRTSTFVEVDEILFDGTEKRIFSGWMFAESPGLNPLAHPVFDLWLTGCSAAAAGTGRASARHRGSTAVARRRPATPAPPPSAPLRREQVADLPAR